MSHRPGKHPRITRHELDRLFDREMDSPSRRDLVGRLGHDPAAADEVNEIRGIVHSMRLRPNETPDMTEAVLARLDREHGFVPVRARRRIKGVRVAVAACLLLGLLGLAIGQRVAPERFRLHAEPTPVADLTDAVSRDSAETGKRLADTVRGLASAHADTRFVETGSEQADATASEPRPGFASLATDDNPGLAVPLAQRYITLTISADAEVLAFSAEASSFIVPEHLAQTDLSSGTGLLAASSVGSGTLDAGTHEPGGLGLGLAYAFIDTGAIHARTPIAGFPPANEFLTVEPGLLPMSFSAPPPAAYIGKRDPFSGAIRSE